MGDKLTYVDTMAFDMLESNLRVDPGKSTSERVLQQVMNTS